MSRRKARFNEAAAADPSCAIAHWGAAMSLYHPLWAPPSKAELERGRAAVAKAEATPAKSDRERDYVAAVASFYRDFDRLDHKTRALAYNVAMADLHKRYPADREAAVFYALSQVAAGTIDNDPNFSREKDAAAILNAVLKEEPDHPGVAHYLIHNFDYPPLADLAVPAAKRYASIAPDSPHAQHMPSHIFTRLGMWEDSISSNLKSAEAAQRLAAKKGFVGGSREELHAMDYLAYAYLQTGQDAKAEGVLAHLNSMQQVDEPIFSVAYAAMAVPARIALENRRWKDAASLKVQNNVLKLAPLENFRWAEAHVHFARAVGAARSGNAAQAREEAVKLRTIEDALVVPPGTYDWRKQVSIERQVAEAWLAYAEGRKDEAVRLMTRRRRPRRRDRKASGHARRDPAGARTTWRDVSGVGASGRGSCGLRGVVKACSTQARRALRRGSFREACRRCHPGWPLFRRAGRCDQGERRLSRGGQRGAAKQRSSPFADGSRRRADALKRLVVSLNPYGLAWLSINNSSIKRVRTSR